MADQEIKVWAQESVQDPVKGNLQRRLIKEEEWLQGWGRLNGITNQQLNQLLYLVTSYSAPADTCPYLHKNTQPIPQEALEMNGQTVSVNTSPVLFNFYGSNLDDLTTAAPTGYTYIVRNH
ncbi:hypothetical protein NVP1193O_181 [Vibrio phage 1.193.O._10N.286.52.C6]|nr:hypothetical protein NVP1193O_181 [Vibrio phage 1.193.O._10N.286.52.C6]